MAECWDSDPDLDFEDSPFALSVPSDSTTDDHRAASLEKRGSSAGLEEHDQDEDWGGDFDGEGIERWKEKATAAAGGTNEERDPFERTAESDASSLLRTKEEEDQSSTSSSRSGTLKGLLSSFSGLSLDSPTNEAGALFIPRSDSTSTFSSSSSSTTAGVNSHDDHTQTLPSTPRPSSRRNSSPQRTPGPTSTLRHSSQLSTLLASATAGPGRVHHLGSTPQGAAKSVLGDWDEDLELDGLDARGLPLERGKELRAKASFASHISDDPEGDAFLEGSRGLPTPRSSRKGTIKPSATNKTAPAPLRGKASTSDFTDQEDDGDFEAESDFELPDDVAQITLSPLLARASNSSLSSHSRNPSQALRLPTTTTTTTPSHLPLPLPTPTLLTRAPSRHSTASPGLSMGGTTTDDEDEDDEAFFEEIVLPPYFLGGPGAMTPPSDGEGFSGGRVDLQGMLRRKLEARGGKAEEKASVGNGKLEGYREREEEEDEGGEAGLVIEVGVKLGAERMRTRSEPKPPALKGRRAFSGSTAMTPSTAARPSSRPPLPRSTSSAAPRPPTSLSRSGSSTSLSTLPNTTTTRSPHSSATSQPSSNRPSSAAGLVERLPRPERRGPPPAPSTAARNRVRARTASLRTTASNGDLRGAAAVGMSTPAGARRPPRLDTTRDQPQLGTAVLSPVPMTPSTPSTTSRPPTLRSRRSQGNLLATPSTAGGGARTMERKRSLQSLPKLELTQGTPVASTSTASRRALRSPTPSTPGTATTSFFSPSSSPTFTRTTTPSTSSRFAAPTASSISRVRERVSSNPVLPPSPLTSTATSFSHLTHPPRPSSAASGRLLQPTASSAAKASPRLPSSASFNSPIAGLRIPSAALKLAKPKKQRAYGDGTELDGFDDLPLTKGERERERTVSQSMRRSSAGAASKGAGGTVKPTASERRSQNRSSGSAGSGGAKEGGSTIKAKPSRSTSAGGSTIKASSSSKLAPPSIAATGSKRLKAESAEEGIEKKSRMAGEEKARRKKEPQLIRNLGAPGMAKVGDMTWNPLLHRWEGNESVLRDFDKALSSSTRPALITQLSSGLSPARVGFPSLSKPIITSSSESATTSAGEETSATSPATSLLSLTPSSHPLRHGSTSSTLSAPNVKVVGSMVFDPVRMSWHSISPEGEDELDLMFEGGDWADDEGDGAGSGRAPSALGRVMGEDGDDDGWAMGEKERMLKNRASFVLSESGDGESDAEGQEGEVRRALRESCEEGEKRCREEFERWGWTSREKDGEEEEMRNDLWNIRELIMDNRSPPRR